MYTPVLNNYVDDYHELFHSANKFIFEDKNSLHFWGPDERFCTHEKLSWGAR